MSKVLVVEPNKEILHDLEQILKTQNYEVILSDSVENAIPIMLNNKPDLIISETSFRGQSGFDLLKIKQSTNDLVNVPLIFLSLETSDTVIRKAMNLGADDYITKPFSAHDLITSAKTRLHKYKTQISNQVRRSGT